MVFVQGCVHEACKPTRFDGYPKILSRLEYENFQRQLRFRRFATDVPIDAQAKKFHAPGNIVNVSARHVGDEIEPWRFIAAPLVIERIGENRVARHQDQAAANEARHNVCARPGAEFAFRLNLQWFRTVDVSVWKTAGRVGLVMLISLSAGAAEFAESPVEKQSAEENFPALSCIAEQTGGFHDHPEPGEEYEPALFHPEAFTLEENVIFMVNLKTDEGGPDLYLTLRATDARETELECRQVRGSFGATGFSCVNKPPSEMLLINRDSLRFTRTAVGGWTFVGASDNHNGDSIFVEYGTCHRQQE